MRTLAVDLLYYGDEAMRYVATETVDEADLATAVLTDEQKALKTTATAIDKSEYVAPADNTGANFRWVSYGARFDNKFGVYFEFIAKSVENLKIKFSSGTEITEFETRTQTIGGSQITVYKAVNELFAVDYANVLTARAYFGETEIGSAITYSVKSLTVDFGSDTKEYALALSACSYGEAAVNYKKTRCLQTQTFVTVNGLGIVKQELEEFDTDKAKTDKDFAAARGVPEDQVFVETPTVDTSGGKSVGAIAKGSQFSTSLKVIENATVNITFVASSTANYKVKDNWKFYIDEVELKLVQNKDIKGGNASQNIWWEWKNTDLGTYNISSGNHVFTAVVENTSCNVDYVAFRVKSYGDYDIGGTELNNQGELGDLYIAENGTYKIEAEDLDKSGWISQQGEGGELTQYWSNDFGDGNCAGFLAQGTVITIKIRTAKSCKLSVVMRVAIPDTSILTDQTVTYYFDEQKLTPSTGGFSFGKRNDADWHYWGDLQLGTIYTEAGVHELRVTIYGVNIDYFTFETTEMQ